MHIENDEYAAYVVKNSEKYLKKFLVFDALGGSYRVFWHWPAFFFTFWWFLYRKMYWWALLFFLAGLIPPHHFWALSHLLCGFAGYFLYYRQARREISALKSNNYNDVRMSCMELGGVNSWVPLLAFIMSLGFFLSLAAFLVWGIFQGFFNMFGFHSLTVIQI